MEIVVDNRIVRLLAQKDVPILKNPLISDPNNHIGFRWASLLESLDLGALFLDLPLFDETLPLFMATVAALNAPHEGEVLFYLFDRLFTECLNQVKALPQINASLLLQAIMGRIKEGNALSSPLKAYEGSFREKTADTMHDLILYLAWDRMCVWMAQIFNHPSTHPIFIQNIGVLRGCLIESYLHIAQNGKTEPGTFRMIEALFFYQMREENLQKPTADEWTMLSQSFPALKPQNELMDFFYIDDEGGSSCYLTQDAPEIVGRRLALAHYVVDGLKSEILEWGYTLQPKNVVSI